MTRLPEGKTRLDLVREGLASAGGIKKRGRLIVSVSKLIEDPRNELVYQLLEHQKFKGAANVLHQRAMMEAAAFSRASMESDEDNPEVAATLFQLFEVFKEVMDRRRAITEIEIARDEMTMAEKIAEIKSMLKDSTSVSARALFERAGSRREMVLTFLAVLDRKSVV